MISFYYYLAPLLPIFFKILSLLLYGIFSKVEKIEMLLIDNPFFIRLISKRLLNKVFSLEKKVLHFFYKQ